jgi:DNA-binding CsgD family transcriptional regulator
LIFYFFYLFVACGVLFYIIGYMDTSTNKNRVLVADSLDSFHPIGSAPGEVSVLDTDQVYHHITPLQDKVLGYGTGNRSLVGKTNFDIDAPAVELAPQFYQECQRVMDTQTSMVFFCSGKFSAQEVINYVYVIAPIQNPRGKPLGIMVQGQRLGNHVDVMAAINQLYQKMDQQGNYKAFLFAPAYPGLTVKESRCLYWTLRGYSAAQIAAQTFVSVRTVESHLVSVKNKYGCATKQELHDYCYAQGLVQILPVLH